MWEILQALITLQLACKAHDTELRWDNTDGDGGLAIRAFIPLTEDDFTFIEQARQMLAPTTQED